MLSPDIFFALSAENLIKSAVLKISDLQLFKSLAISIIITLDSSSIFASKRSAALYNILALSLVVLFFHSFCAVLAYSITSSTSTVVIVGTFPKSELSIGDFISINLPLELSCHSPFIKFLYNLS